MPLRNLASSVTSTSNIRSVTIEESYSQLSANAVIEADTTSLSLGDSITVGLGYDTPTTIFSGFVKKVTRTRPDNLYRIEANDVLVRAIDFFIAADDPEKPFQRNNIESLQLVKDLLALAGITNVTNTAPSPSFIWGTNEDGARFNLQSVADAIQFIAQITGNVVFSDSSGQIQFTGRKPFVDAGDVATVFFTTGASGNIIDISREVGTDRTRNRVVVYGKESLKAVRRADNANLVVDQAVVIAHELL